MSVVAGSERGWLSEAIRSEWLREGGLDLPDGLPYEHWAAMGHVLRTVERNALWWLGDWWNYGEREYGEMASQEAKDAVTDATGYAYETVKKAAWVASRVTQFRRRNNLSWSHHYEVAALPEDEADAWLDQAEAEGWSHRELRKQIKQSRYLEAQAVVSPVSGDDQGSGTVYEADAIEFLAGIGPGTVDLLLTDPPYMTDVPDIEAFARQWVPAALATLKPSSRAYICTGAYPRELMAYLAAFRENEAPVALQQVLVWSYENTLGPAPSHDYKLNWQAIFYLRGRDAPPLTCPMMVEQFTVQDLAAPDGRHGNRLHTWQKPDALGERFVRHATNAGAVVLDPFAGTGTFVAAARRLGRRGIGCERDPQMLRLCAERGLEVCYAT